jgi:hypothetical protein
MLLLILVLLLALLMFGLGFVAKWLFIIAAIVAVVWLIGLFAHAPEARWYRW